MSLTKQDKFDSSFLLLGCGYLGAFFLKKHPEINYTLRQSNLLSESILNGIYFDLKDKQSWENLKNLKSIKNVLWMFPAANHEADILDCVSFFKDYFLAKKVIVLSSTSAYCVKNDSELIDETSTLLLSHARFDAEEKLRSHGALILHLSGIIGPDRTPLNWYKKNLVKNGKGVLNYIHVQDIIYFIEKLFLNFAFSERFNLTSQNYKKHEEIASLLIKNGLLEENFQFFNDENSKKNKKVSCAKILSYLKEENYNFIKYPEDIEY